MYQVTMVSETGSLAPTLVLGNTHQVAPLLGGSRTFLFDIHSVKQKGWAFLQLVRLVDELNGVQTTLDYDPSVHDRTSHYMGSPWRARKSDDTFTLIGAFGDPGSRILLERI